MPSEKHGLTHISEYSGIAVSATQAMEPPLRHWIEGIIDLACSKDQSEGPTGELVQGTRRCRNRWQDKPRASDMLTAFNAIRGVALSAKLCVVKAVAMAISSNADRIVLFRIEKKNECSAYNADADRSDRQTYGPTGTRTHVNTHVKRRSQRTPVCVPCVFYEIGSRSTQTSPLTAVPKEERSE